MYESLITPATPTPATPEPAAAALPAQRQPASVGEFVSQNLPLAQRVAEKTGVAPEVLLGQWGLETGWGKSVIPGTNNLGNIKDPSRRGPMATDNMTGSRDAYLQFETPDDFGNHYSGLIARRYASAMNSGGDAQKFFSELKRNGYAEDPAYVQSGMRAASMAASALGNLKPAAPTEPQQYYSPQRGQYASLITPPPERGFGGAVADTGLSLAQGAVGAVQSLTNLAGANNPASETLGDASKFLQTQKSAQSQATLASSQQRVREAEATGDWTQELGAYMQMLWDQPAEMLAQGVGSFATLGVGKLAQAAKLASSAKAAGVSKEAFFKSKEGLEAIKAASDVGFRTNVGVSAAQGVGAVKGSQYEQTFNAAKAKGLSDQEAAALADEAQAYGGAGTGQQLLGGVLGAGAASVGPIERLVAGRGVAKAASIPGGAAKGFFVEGGTEGAQGGQERYAGNAAAIDAGVLDESKRYQGVAGQMALEGALGGVLGGGAGALESALAPAVAPTVPPALQPVADKAAEPNSPLSRAAMASAPLAAAAQADQQAAEQAAEPAKPEFDDIFQRAKAIEDATRTNNGLQALRQEDSPVNTKQFLNDLAVAKSQSTNPALREQALSRLEFAAEWAGFDVAPPEARPATEPAAPLDQVGQAMQMAKELSANDRSQVVAALATYRNPALPQATRDAALDQALEIIGRNQAGQMPTQPAGQSPAVLGDIAPQPGTPEYFIREAERREQGAEQFRAYGFPEEAAALQAEADSLRENAASARAGELGVEMPTESDADIATPAPQQTVEQATQNLPRVQIPAPVAGEVSSADNTAARRKRKAQLGQLVSLGFGTAESRGGQYILKNAKTGQEVVLEGPADFQLARAAVQQAQRAIADSSPNSPTNDKTPASEARIAAGNYAKPADVVNGIPIRYENPAGSTRSGTDPGGKPWSVTMKYDYGHDDRVVGADGDKLDIKVGRNPSSPKIFVVDQVNPDGSFDEHKVVLGANSEEDARQTYLADYEPGWQGLGAITEITKAQYDEWTRTGAVTEPMMLGREDKMFTVSDGGVPVRLMAIDPEDMSNPSAPRSGKGKLIAKKDAELIKAIGLLFGLNTQFFRSMTPGWSSDGFYQGGNTLYLSERTTVSPLAVFGHEFMHLIKRVNPKAYAAIAKVVSANVKDPKGYREDYYGKYVVQDAKGETITYMRDQKRAELAAAEAGGKVAEHGTGPLNEAELEEMVSDLNGNLMTDSKFWGEVFRQVEKANGTEAKGIISQLAAFLNRMIDQLVDSLKGRQFNVGQFVNETKAVRNAFRDGLATFITESGGKVRAVELQAEILRATQKAKKVDVQRSPEREGGWSVIADKIPTRAAAQQMLETLDAQRYEFNIVADPEDNTLQIEARRLGQGERSSAIVVRQKRPRAHTQLKKIGPLNWTAITDLSLEGLEMLISTVTRGNTLVSTEITRSGDGISQREIRQTKPGPINQMSIGNEHKSILSMIRSTRLNDRLNTGFMPEIRKSEQRDDGLTVEAYHFSQQPRPTLSTDRFGTGLRGSGRDEIMAYPDGRVRRRLSFYVNKGGGIRPEGGVGSIAHKATLTNIYDADADPLRMRSGNAREFEGKVMDAGYNGYLQRMDGSQPGQVILLGDQTIEPEILGPRTRITDAAVVPPPMLRVADLADRINNNRNLPAGALTPQRWTEVLMMQMPNEAAELLNLGAIAGNDPMYRGEFASAVRRQAAPMRKSTERAEYAEVEAKYRDSDEWLKAPNGKATKLSERQWVQTRTPSFLKWFGDWLQAHQDGGVWATKLDVSKVVTLDGEPMVVYHGSDEGGFVEFKRPGGTRRGDLGIFTTDNYSMARSYVHRGRFDDVMLTSDPTNQAELEAAGYSFDENDDGEIEVTSPDGYLQDRYPDLEAAVADTLDNLDAPDTAGDTPGVYALFVNLRNPNESNFEGAYWNGARPEQYMVVDADGEQLYKPDGSAFFADGDEAQAFANDNDGTVEPAPEHYEDTDGVVREAILDKADGAIIREVIDDGGGPGYDYEPSNIFVALDPTQLKSADYNDGAFSPKTSDLRKSADRAGDVARHNLMADRNERTTASRVVLSDKERAAIEAGARLGLMTAAEIEDSVRTTKAAHPMADGWAPLVFDRVKVEKNEDGEGEASLIYKAVPYSFNADSNGKALNPGSTGHKRAIGRIARNMVDDVLAVYKRATAGDKAAKNIIEQAAWYKAMRTRLRQEFGGLGDLFADLLGATSPNTPVRGNWDNAVDSLRRAMRGDFDELMPGWLAWAKHLDDTEARFKDFFNAMLERGLLKKQIKELGEYQWLAARAAEAREIPDNLLPAKESGKKYGFNGKNVVRAMVDLWRVVKDADPDINRGGTAPKALNFSGNLIGFRDRSTIDVWAARNLQRNSGGLRIPSVAETGVSGDMLRSGATTLQFGFGQDVFTRAVSLIRNDPDMVQNDVLRQINDDDLQALIWFVEKEIWTKNNWTSAAGEGGSFEFESDLAGALDQDLVRKLRRIADSSIAASLEQKAAAQARLYELADELEPYQNAGEAMTKVSKAKKAVDEARSNDGSARAERKLASKQADLADAVRLMNDALDDLPKSRRSTGKVATKIKELRAEGTRLANIFKKPLPEQLRANREAALRDLGDMARTVDRFIIGLSLEKSSELQGGRRVPTDDEQAAAASELRDATYQADDGRTVLASKFYSTEGRYGKPERAIDGEVVARDGYDPRPLATKVFEVAQREQQDSAFVARILRADEEVDPLQHRPGVEIYFRNAAAAAQAEALMRRVNRTAVPRAGVIGDRRARFFRVGGYTVIVDGRRTPESLSGAMPKAVGMRIMYLPEFNARYGDTEMFGLDDSQIRDKMTLSADDLVNFVDRVIQRVPEVSFGGRFNYEVDARFADEYQGAIDGYTDRDAAAGNRASPAKAWSGRSVREAVAAAIGRDGTESAQSESAVPDSDGQSGGIRKSAERGDDRRGDPGGGRAPLPGAPSNEGTQGPDAALVAVAEQYARDNGITLKRQAEYVQVDPELGRRISDTYSAMRHTPDDPRVQASYNALIRETRAQYDALFDAGYRFTFFDKGSDPYRGNPWNAMRDLRKNKSMAVYGTYDGYGNEVTGFKAKQNLLVVPTGLRWADQSGVMRDVTANDLFRAVHDAFGHGLEGAGFRGRGEANAFEAHARLYSPAALMALANETRAQNSWLNFNDTPVRNMFGDAKAAELHPDNWRTISVGEHNQTASVDDTIFADQKNGVLPEWLWTEGRAADMAPTDYNRRADALKELIACLRK